MSAVANGGVARILPAADGQLELFRRYGEHTSGFLAFNREMRCLTGIAADGYVAYRTVGRRQAVQLCGPVTAPEHREALTDEFLAWASRKGRRVTAVQLRREDVVTYAQRGFKVNQLGCAFSVDLEQFTLRGTRFMKLRNKIARARRAGVSIIEIPDLDGAAQLDEIDRRWMRGKGRTVQQLAFLVGERGGRGAAERRILCARKDGSPIAYVTFAPVRGTQRPGRLYDLTRRQPDAPPGTVEMLFTAGIDMVREEGHRWLHLGLTPFVGLGAEHPAPEAQSRAVAAAFGQLAKRGAALYPATSQEAFKRKWSPTLVEPEYVAFQRRPSVGALIGLMRLTGSIPWRPSTCEPTKEQS